MAGEQNTTRPDALAPASLAEQLAAAWAETVARNELESSRPGRLALSAGLFAVSRCLHGAGYDGTPLRALSRALLVAVLHETADARLEALLREIDEGGQ